MNGYRQIAPQSDDQLQNTAETQQDPFPLSVCFLGGSSIKVSGEEIKRQLPRNCLALFAYLAASGKAYSRDALAALLWSDFPEDRARANLRDLLSRLRRTPLATCFRIDRRSVSFEPSPFLYYDVLAFSQNLNLGRGLTADIAALETAVDLYRGEFLQGFQARKAALFEEWLDEQRRGFQAKVVQALQKLSEYYLNEGRLDPASRYLHRLLSIEPCMEEAHRSLMLVLFMQGDYEAAIRQYRVCEKLLFNELGIQPSQETCRLLKNIRTHVEDDSFRPDRTVQGQARQASVYVPHDLPNQFTPFIGRNREQRVIETVLKDRTARLITLLGVGGSGKTRLAIAIGGKQARSIERDGSFRFLDGVYFVALEAVEDVRAIVPAVCRAIDFQPTDEARASRPVKDQLLSYLGGKRMLLVLDNFEQILSGVGLLVDILRKTQHVCLLVTSRQKLGLQGERLFSIGGLRYPDSLRGIDSPEMLESNFSAPRLFITIVRRSKPDFRLSTDQIPALIRLCRLVDGLPLALELAAGWTDVLPIDRITTEIDSEMSILESRYADFPDRHRSMEAVFDVSWRRLADSEKRMFMQLCVFRGGFGHKAASEIIGINYRQLASLLTKALVQSDENTSQFWIHPLLRNFGAAKLAADPAVESSVRERHCAYYCALLGKWNQDVTTSRQLETLEDFDQENANARAAWNYALETCHIDRLEHAVDGIFRLYLWRRRFLEGESAGRKAEAFLVASMAEQRSPTDHARRKRLLARIKIWRSVFAESSNADKLLKESFQILTHPDLSELDTRRELAMGYLRSGDLVFSKNSGEAGQLYEKSLALFRETSDIWGAAKALTQMGWEAIHLGKAEEALRFGNEALDLVRATGDYKRTADILWMLGTLAVLQGDVTESTRLLIESLEIREQLGDRITDIMTGPLDLGMTLTWIGRFAEADRVRQEALELYKEQGLPEQIAWAHIRLATSKFHIGDYEAGETQARIGLAQCRALENHHGAGFTLWLLSCLAMLAGDYAEATMYLKSCLEAFDKVEGAVEVSWVQSLGAELAYREGKVELARGLLCEAFRIASGVMGLVAILGGVNTYCRMLLDQDRKARAIEMFTLIKKHPLSRSQFIAAFFDERLEKTRQTLTPIKLTEAEARGFHRDFYETAKEVVEELVGEGKA